MIIFSPEVDRHKTGPNLSLTIEIGTLHTINNKVRMATKALFLMARCLAFILVLSFIPCIKAGLYFRWNSTAFVRIWTYRETVIIITRKNMYDWIKQTVGNWMLECRLSEKKVNTYRFVI